MRIASVLVILLGVISILAGLLGLLLAGKKSLLTVIMGVILFVAQLWNFFQAGNGAIEIVINIVLLVIPYYYLHNADLRRKHAASLKAGSFFTRIFPEFNKKICGGAAGRAV